MKKAKQIGGNAKHKTNAQNKMKKAKQIGGDIMKAKPRRGNNEAKQLGGKDM